MWSLTDNSVSVMESASFFTIMTKVYSKSTVIFLYTLTRLRKGYNGLNNLNINAPFTLLLKAT